MNRSIDPPDGLESEAQRGLLDGKPKTARHSIVQRIEPERGTEAAPVSARRSYPANGAISRKNEFYEARLPARGRAFGSTRTPWSSMPSMKRTIMCAVSSRK